mgnify:CR=1 FL=1
MNLTKIRSNDVSPFIQVSVIIINDRLNLAVSESDYSLESGKVFITSQNHGFSVDPKSLSKSLKITHLSLFDESVQGIERSDVPAFGFQGHPEASPGPTEMSYLFDKFIAMIKNARAKNE